MTPPVVNEHGVRRFAVTVPAEVSQAARVRRLVAAHLRHWQRPELVDDGTLVVHELFVNAVTHGSRAGDEVVVEGELRQAELYVAVTDTSVALPTTDVPCEEDEHGRGLAIVEALAASWDTRRRGDRKVVWAVMPLNRHPVPSRS
ncbi:ATP-binding protein [Streptomyces sp. 4N509B]|uniref:ATP-binding protein n=1 Tax=Streptomyces sp. 4N509B TaxID=3457413 RepID=UPI003FD03162